MGTIINNFLGPVILPLRVEQHERAINSLQAPFVYSVTDDYFHVEIPPVPPSANAGDVHIHRNRLNDEVSIWILSAKLQWVSCSTSWAVKTQSPVRHPLYPGLILDTFGSSYIPSYIKETTYRSRSADRRGLARMLL